MKENSSESAGAKFQRLVEIMAKLRAPGGCPWDREQTLDTLKPFLIEEAYEVLDAIDARDWPGLADELGDLLLQPVFQAQLASEDGKFNIEDALDAICNKLVRRHPHVFGDGDAKTPDDVKRRWDEIKAEERKNEKKTDGLLDSVSRNTPGLVEARQISSKAANAGFDWENAAQVFDKVREEIGELDGACIGGPSEMREEEIGDLLFTIVNLARFLSVDPEQALRKTNAKFRRRFRHVEEGLAARGKRLADATLDEMETLWQEAKQAG